MSLGGVPARVRAFVAARKGEQLAESHDEPEEKLTTKTEGDQA